MNEKWMIYTISYNGEDYFADQVFALTEDQKELAADYAGNLSLFLGDGLVQNLAGWEGNSIPSLGDVRFTDVRHASSPMAAKRHPNKTLMNHVFLFTRCLGA